MSGESTSSPSTRGLPPPSPLCLFYFSHPFKIGTPEHVHAETSEPRHQYRGTMGNVIQRSRHIPRRRFPGVRHLGSYLLATAGVQESKPAPSLDEVLRIIREAWTTPRTSSLDREPGTSDGSATRRRPMGTTGRKVSPGGQRTRHQLPSNPRPGLPHRRYSVPETVMRKYTLTKQREMFLESPADTSTTTATAPAAPCPESSSEVENRLSVASEIEEGSGSDRSRDTEHSSHGGEVPEQLSHGKEDIAVTNNLTQGSRSSQSLEVSGHPFQSQEDCQTGQDEEHEYKEEQSHSSQQVPPRIRRKSSPSRSKPPSRTSTVLDTVSEETGNDLAATSAQEKDDWTSSSATLGVPMSTSATTGSSPHEDIAAAATLPYRNVTSCPAAMELVHSQSSSPDDKQEETSTKEEATSTASREETSSSPLRPRGKEEDDTMPNSTLADDLSSTQTFGCSSTEPSKRPQSHEEPGDADQTTSSPEPHTTERDNLSSTQDFEGNSTAPSSTPQSHDQPEDAHQAKSSPDLYAIQRGDLSSSQTSEPSSRLQSHGKLGDGENATPSPESFTTQRDDVSTTQTFTGTSTEPNSRPQSDDQSRDAEHVTPSLDPLTTQRDDLSAAPSSVGTSTEPSSRTRSHDHQGDVNEMRNTSTGIFSSLEDTMEPHTTQRDELSSSQTFGIVSEETAKSSQDVRTSSTLSEESTLGRISGQSTSTPEARAASSTSPERLPPSEFEKTTSSGYSGERTTTDCCVSTSPSCSLAMSTSSPDQPVTERSTSTQDQTFSVRSESVTFGRPASVIRTPKSITSTPPPAPAGMSDSEQSLGHIEFMNKEEADFAGIFSKILKTQNNDRDVRSSSIDDVFGSEVKIPEEGRNVRDIACQVEMCESTDASVSADERTQSKPQTSLPTTEDSGHITEDASFCGTNKLNTEHSSIPIEDVEVLQKRSWEIIIQPKCYGTVIGANNTRATFRTLSNKISVLPSKVQEADFFNGPKTYLVIRPSQVPVSTDTTCCATKASTPTTKEQTLKSKPETESVDGAGPYSWSRLSEEEWTVRMQHQKHRLWMNRRLASAHALPRSPDLTAAEGALSACVGPGSAYREPPLRDAQLVVPRYSALPRSVSMLVNTSSGECSSNSNSDSECLSLVDSLDESPKSRSKHDIATKLLPEGATSTGRSIVLPATPRGKGKAFFVSMAGGLDKVVPVDDTKEPIVAHSMPDKLKRKLSQRQQLIEQRRRKKQTACHNLTGQNENRENSAEVLQQHVQEMAKITQSGIVPQTLNAEILSSQVQNTNDGNITAEVQKSGNGVSPQASLDAEMKSYLKRRRSKDADKRIQEAQYVTDSSSKPADIQHVSNKPTVKNISQAGPSEVENEIYNLGNRSRRKSKKEKMKDNSSELSESLDDGGPKEAHKSMVDSQNLTNSSPKSDELQHVPSQTSLKASCSETGNKTDTLDNRARRKSRAEKVLSKSPELLESLDEKRAINTDKNAQEAQNLMDTSPKSDDLLVSSQALLESHSTTSPLEGVNEIHNLSKRRTSRKSETEKVQNSPELSESLNEKSAKGKDKNLQDSQDLVDSSPKSVGLEHVPVQTFTETHSQTSSSEVGNEVHSQDNRKGIKSKTENVQSNLLELSKTAYDHDVTQKTECQNKEQDLPVESHANTTVSDPPVGTTREDFKLEENTASSVNTGTTEDKSPETVNTVTVTAQVHSCEKDVSRTKPKRKCREPMKRAKSEPLPKLNKSSEEESESVVEGTNQVLTASQKMLTTESTTSKEGTALYKPQESKENNQTSGTEKISTLKNQVQKNSEACKFKNPIAGSSEELTAASKSIPALQTEVQEGIKTAESLASVPRRPASRIPIDHANCQRTDYGAGTIKNRPQHRKHRVRKKSPPAALSSSNSTPATSPAGEAHSTRISQIPVMKSPVSLRRNLLMDPSSIRSSQLPMLRSRFLQSPPVRRSANLRFQQRFEVIPEERSASLESSAEDQATNQQKIMPKPVRPASEAPYTALHNRYRPAARKPYQNSSSSSNQDESRIPVRRPVMFQSRIPRPAVKDEARPVQQLQSYSGSRAALAPHMDDTDLVTLSKGWLNFYLLKDGRGTPDSVVDEASSANISDQEDRHSAKRRRAGRFKRTVTVVGADENRVRQYTLSHQSNEEPSPLQELSPEQAPEEVKSERPSSQGTTLPALDANVSRRPSLEKLPLELPETEDSDHSTAYLCLPSPNRQHRANSGLLEGSGELACSELSVSSSDEGEKTVFPVRWPSRPMRSRVHRSRSRSNHCRRELLQSYLQTGTGPGSAGWTVTVAGSNGGLQQQPPDLEMHVTFPANVRRTAASQSDSGLGEDNNGGGAGAEDEDSKSRKDEEDLKADGDDVDQTQTHRWTVVLKNQGAADRVPELTKSGKRPHQCLPDLSYQQNQSKNLRKPTKKTDGSLPVTSATDEDARKGSMQKRLSQLWPKVQKILESKVIIRKASGHFSQEVKSVSQLLENDIGEMMVRSGLAIKGSAITPEKKPRVPTMSERDLTRVHTAKH